MCTESLVSHVNGHRPWPISPESPALQVRERQEELGIILGVPSSGTLSKMLAELESCGFVRKYHPFDKKNRGSLFQLIDYFTLFHHKFLLDGGHDEHFWSNRVNTLALNAWRGVAFERVCLEHVPQIKDGMLAEHWDVVQHLDPDQVPANDNGQF